jgi:nitroreductase
VVPQVFFEILKLPPGFAITLLVAVGYPAETPAPPLRKSIEKIAEFREAAET